jgi:hypothetical protein
MKSILPIILVILILSGAITYSLSKRTITQLEESRFGITANKLSGSVVTPTPFALTTPTPKPTETKISPLPTVTETVTETKGGQKIASGTVTKITKTIVCTPVYGQANTCTEHIVVDTGAADAIFFNFAGLSYLAGLAAFVKAKTLKK